MFRVVPVSLTEASLFMALLVRVRAIHPFALPIVPVDDDHVLFWHV